MRRAGADGPRRPGIFAPSGRRGAPPRHGWSIARALLAPTWQRGGATSGASRGDAEPVETGRADGFCPGGAEGSNDRAMMRTSSAPAGAGVSHETLSTGCAGEAPTPPVATGRDPSGVSDCGRSLNIGARGRAGGVRFRSVEVAEAPAAARPSDISGPNRACGVLAINGEVPEGRHAPLASADQHAASGEGVRYGQ